MGCDRRDVLLLIAPVPAFRGAAKVTVCRPIVNDVQGRCSDEWNLKHVAAIISLFETVKLCVAAEQQLVVDRDGRRICGIVNSIYSSHLKSVLAIFKDDAGSIPPEKIEVAIGQNRRGVHASQSG